MNPRKGETRLARLEDGIDRLRNRIATPMGEIKERIDRDFPDLRSRAEAARTGVRAAEAAGASNRGRLKNAVDEGLKDLGHAIDQTLEKIRRTGSGNR
jgi:hypothetical protein